MGFWSELKALVLKYLILRFQNHVDDIDEKTEELFYKNIDKLEHIKQKQLEVTPVKQRKDEFGEPVTLTNRLLDDLDEAIEAAMGERDIRLSPTLLTFRIPKTVRSNLGSIYYLKEDHLFIQSDILNSMGTFDVSSPRVRRSLIEFIRIKTGVRADFDDNGSLVLTQHSFREGGGKSSYLSVTVPIGATIDFVKNEAINKPVPRVYNTASMTLDKARDIKSLYFFIDANGVPLVFLKSKKYQCYFDLNKDMRELTYALRQYGLKVDYHMDPLADIKVLTVIDALDNQGAQLTNGTTLNFQPKEIEFFSVPKNYSGTSSTYITEIRRQHKTVSGLLEEDIEEDYDDFFNSMDRLELGIDKRKEKVDERVKKINERVDEVQKALDYLFDKF